MHWHIASFRVNSKTNRSTLGRMSCWPHSHASADSSVKTLKRHFINSDTNTHVRYPNHFFQIVSPPCRQLPGSRNHTFFCSYELIALISTFFKHSISRPTSLHIVLSRSLIAEFLLRVLIPQSECTKILGLQIMYATAFYLTTRNCKWLSSR